jgi:phage gpG-like protein
MSETGPAGLKALIEQLSDVSKGRFMDPASKAVGHQAVVHIKDCFAQGRSPYGEPWEPVARGGKPLLDTARLRNAFIDDSGNGRVAINNPTKYGPLQNDGGVVKAKGDGYLTFPMKMAGAPLAMRGGAVTKRRASSKQWVKVKQVTIKARPFIPDERGIPPEWEAKMATVARALFAKLYPKLVP